MELRLTDHVEALPGVGSARAKALAKLGLATIEDLLRYFPRDYEDRRRSSTISAAPPDAPVCIAALEGEFIGGLYGALAGLLCDLAGSWVFGFHAILCLCCNVAVGLAAIYLVRRSLGSVMLLSLGVLLLTQLLGYFFHYAIWGYEGVSLILWRHTLPAIAYSVLATLPLYYYTAWLEAKFPQQD